MKKNNETIVPIILAGGAGERLTRDINLALIDVMGRSGTGFTPVAKKTNTIKSIKTGEEITDVVQYANKSPENKIEVKKKYWKNSWWWINTN